MNPLEFYLWATGTPHDLALDSLLGVVSDNVVVAADVAWADCGAAIRHLKGLGLDGGAF